MNQFLKEEWALLLVLFLAAFGCFSIVGFLLPKAILTILGV